MQGFNHSYLLGNPCSILEKGRKFYDSERRQCNHSKPAASYYGRSKQGTQEPQGASVPVTINWEDSAGRETTSPAPDPGWRWGRGWGMERTMNRKESKRKTRKPEGKLKKKSPLGNSLQKGLNFRSD